MALYILSFAMLVIVWPTSIAAAALAAERTFGPTIGRSMWILFAVFQSFICFLAFNELNRSACANGLALEICEVEQ